MQKGNFGKFEHHCPIEVATLGRTFNVGGVPAKLVNPELTVTGVRYRFNGKLVLNVGTAKRVA